MVNYKQKFLKYKLKYQKIRQTGGVNCGLLNENDCKDNANECKWNPVIKKCSKITTRFKNIEPSFNLDYEDGGEYVLDQTFDVERSTVHNETASYEPRTEWQRRRPLGHIAMTASERAARNATMTKEQQEKYLKTQNDAARLFTQYYKSAQKDTNKPKLVRCRNCKKGKKTCLCVDTYPEGSDEFGEFIVAEDGYREEKY